MRDNKFRDIVEFCADKIADRAERLTEREGRYLIIGAGLILLLIIVVISINAVLVKINPLNADCSSKQDFGRSLCELSKNLSKDHFLWEKFKE